MSVRSRVKQCMLMASTVGVTSGMLMGRTARAATFYWDGDGATTAATGGSGPWNTSSSLWRSGSTTGSLGSWPTTGTDNDAMLAGTAGTLTVGTAIAVNDLSVAPTSNGKYTIDGVQTLTFNGAVQSTLDVATGSTLAITSVVSGLNGFSKTGSGVLVFDRSAGSTNLLGGVSVGAGTLQLGSAANEGANFALRSSALTLSSGANLTSGGTAATIDMSTGALSGGGTVTLATTGSLNIYAQSNGSFSGAISGAGDVNIRGGNGTAQIFSGNLTGLAGTLTVYSGVTVTLQGTGSNTGVTGGGFYIRGGALELNNSNGNTTAVAGRLPDMPGVTIGGGTLTFTGAVGGSSERAGALRLNSGANQIVLNSNDTTKPLTMNFSNSGTYNLGTQTAMTTDFSAVNGTLGGGGNNPSIKFDSAPNTDSNTGLMTNLLGSDTGIGWATVNHTDWAVYDVNNGIKAFTPTLTTSTASGLQSASASSIVLYTPGSSQSLSATVTSGTLKIAPTTSGLSLSVGGLSIKTSAIMLTGANDFAITSTNINGVWGALGDTGVTRYIHVMDANAVLSTNANLASINKPIVKSGPGFFSLNASTSQVVFGSVQTINIVQGVLRATPAAIGGGTASGGANTTISLFGGVLEINGNSSPATFIRALGLTGTASGGGIRWDNGAVNRGDGGFSAYNGNATVTLSSAVGNSTAAAVTWDSGGFVASGYALLMGSIKADSRIKLTNTIALDNIASINGYAAREVRVADNPNSTTDIAELSGVISGTSNADLMKTGAGVLELTASNTYTGNTLVRQGTLRVNNTAAGSGTGTGRVVVTGSGTVAGVGTISGQTFVNSGGAVAPGNAAVGTLTTGGLAMSAGGHLSIDVDVTNSKADQLISTATVDLGSGVAALDLVLSDAVTKLYSGSFLLLRNDSGTALNGYFAGLNPGVGTTASFASGSLQYTINYAFSATGDGVANDVQITFVSVPEPCTGAAVVGLTGAICLLQRRRRALVSTRSVQS